MATYTVKQLARLSGVSVRALHHYDEIGLLKPAFTGENRYRYYGREELLRLQNILFHRELGVSLHEIALLLDAGSRDRLAILREHRAMLAEQLERSRQLLRTIDRTIAELNGEGTMKDNELYKGFSPEKQAEHEEWLVEKYGDAVRPTIERSKQVLSEMGEEGRTVAFKEGDAVIGALAERFNAGDAPDDAGLLPLLDRHVSWVSVMWGRECTPMAYAGLANLYLTAPGFPEQFEARGTGFTSWIAEAMKLHAPRIA